MNNNIEEHMVRQLAEQIQFEIDTNVYFEALEILGWTLVNYTVRSVEANEWLKENCIHDYQIRGAKIAFESAKDATAFSIKWL